MKKLLLPYISLWLPLLTGLLLLSVPLLGNFHIESALFAATIGCFWAGVMSCKLLVTDKTDGKRIFFILRTLYLAGLPLLIFALFNQCFSWHGLDFWILYPIPSVLFGYALGRMLRLWQMPFRKTLSVIVLLIVTVVIPLIQFFNLPQVYFFNHVWGGWPGPIYDETITVSWPLLFFRLLTLLWAGLFWLTPSFKDSIKAKAGVIFCVSGLILGYIFLPQLGIVSPRSYIQKQLGSVKETAHFTFYYKKSGYTKDEIALIALEHEFYYEQISEALNLSETDSKEKIESYLYANVRQKNRLTGAKYTSYVPVWLEQDQLHVAKGQLESLKHELVHVLAKQFGNELLNASWSIGLVEGLAVALAGGVSSRTTIHQIVAAEKPWPNSGEMKYALSPTGFYGGRSAVNYTTSGSFVKYLLSRYPAKYFKEAYRTADIEGAYPQSFRSLITGWHNMLREVVVDSLDRQIAARLFSIPSLFEQACPHVLSPIAQRRQNYHFFLIIGDSLSALKELTALRNIGNNDRLTAQWLFLSIKTGNLEQALSLNYEHLKTKQAKLRYADALALKEKWDSAETIINDAKVSSDSLNYLLRQSVNVRSDDMQWRFYLNLVHRNHFFDLRLFQRLNYHLQLLSIKKAIEQERWRLFKQYAAVAVEHALNSRYFDLYIKITHYLSFRGQFGLAGRWMQKISALSLRNRYLQRLRDEKRWLRFLKKMPLQKY